MIDHYNSFNELYSCLRGRGLRIEPAVSNSGKMEEGKMKYKLSEIVTTPTLLYVQQTASAGKTKWGSVRLIPGTIYETEDHVLMDSLMARGYMKVPYNERLENRLKELGKEYTVEVCKSCGGRVKKIKYHAVEIVE